MEKNTKKKFRLRFSYFLVVGLIGYVLQAIGYFMWTTEEYSWSQISASSSMDYFNYYTRISYFIMFSALCIGVMCVGIILGAKKEQKLLKIASEVLLGGQAILLISSIVYLIYAHVTRSTMDDEGYREFLVALIAIKNAAMYLSGIATAAMGFFFIKVNKDRKLSKVGSWVMLVCNGLFVLALTVLFFGTIATPAYELISKWFDTTSNIYLKTTGTSIGTSQFASNYVSMNGFTWSNMVRCFTFIQECNTSIYPENVDWAIVPGAVFAIISIITYGLSIVGNFVFTILDGIESFDVSRDDDRMAL